MKLTTGRPYGALARNAIGTALCVLLFSSALVAGGQLPTVEQRSSGADHVVVATARRVTAEWRQNDYGDRIIVSKVLLEVEETLKGGGLSSAVLEVDGGTLDGLTLRVSGLHVPEIGERAVVFMDAAEGGVQVPHLRGLGILPLDADDVVHGSTMRLDEIRTRVRGQ
jgi:hypothetical protein